MHARKQIRDAVITTLTGLAATGVNVFGNRAHMLSASNLPALRLFTRSESVEVLSMDGTQQRVLQLNIEAIDKASTALDDRLDVICTEVETALLNNVPAHVRQLVLDSTEIEFNGEGDQPHGIARMSFSIEYYTREGDPEVLL